VDYPGTGTAQLKYDEAITVLATKSGVFTQMADVCSWPYLWGSAGYDASNRFHAFGNACGAPVYYAGNSSIINRISNSEITTGVNVYRTDIRNYCLYSAKITSYYSGGVEHYAVASPGLWGCWGY
jgi:hypothetical protein